MLPHHKLLFLYFRVEHGRTVLRKGHEGLAFYFIFSGSAFVNVEELLVRSGHVVWHTAVVLHRGDSFGVGINGENHVQYMLLRERRTTK